MTERSAVSPEDRIYLVRHHVFSEAAALDLPSGRFERLERRPNPAKRQPYWLPALPIHGFFDELGGLLVALYRVPSEPDTLWLRLGPQVIAVDEVASSRFSPSLTEGEPLLANASVLRRFELSIHGAVQAAHEYRLDDSEKRLARGADPFPAWPDDEENYDLLLFVHRVIDSGCWPRVLRDPLLG
jgi:hypothetical protein